jgi:hypothetical protein
LAGTKTKENTVGYTHYWNQKIWDKKDADGYLAALPILQQIAKKHKKIIQLECDEKKPARVNIDGIHLNGIDDYGHETFFFAPKECDFSFCKTAQKPYDLPVCEMLLVLKAYIPHFELSSDGFSGYAEKPEIDGNWGGAIEAVKQYGIFYKIVVESQGPGREKYVNIYPVFDRFESAVAAGMKKEPAEKKSVKKMKKPSKKELLVALKNLVETVKAVADNSGLTPPLAKQLGENVSAASAILAKA